MTLKFFWYCFKMNIATEMVYKVNFIIRTLTLLSFDLVIPFITVMIYLNTNGFPGWSFNQILLFQGIFILMHSLDRFFSRGVNWTLSSDVRSGNFDRYLLYPINTILYISFTNLLPEQLPQIFLGIGVIVYSLIKLKLSFDLISLVLLIIYFALALVLIFSIQIIQYAIVLRTVMLGRLNEFIMNVKRFGEYPVDIYNSLLGNILRYVVPMTVLAYYPSSILLQTFKSSYLFSIISVSIIFIISIMFWNSSLKKYSSAGG